MNFVYLIILIFSINTTNCTRDAIELKDITSLCSIWIKKNISLQLLCSFIFVVVLILILYIKTLKHIEKKFKHEYEKCVNDKVKNAVDSAMKEVNNEMVGKFVKAMLSNNDFIKKVSEEKEVIEVFAKAVKNNSNNISMRYSDEKKSLVFSIINKLNGKWFKVFRFNRNLFSEEEIKYLENALLIHANQQTSITNPS